MRRVGVLAAHVYLRRNCELSHPTYPVTPTLERQKIAQHLTQLAAAQIPCGGLHPAGGCERRKDVRWNRCGKVLTASHHAIQADRLDPLRRGQRRKLEDLRL